MKNKDGGGRGGGDDFSFLKRGVGLIREGALNRGFMVLYSR